MIPHKPRPGHSLEEHNPELLPEWSDYNDIQPVEISYGSNFNVWWICPEGHEDYVMSCKDRNRGRGCKECGYSNLANIRSIPPYEKSLGYLYPSIASTWSPKNSKSPFEVYPNSHKKYIWVCFLHGEYEMTCHERVADHLCNKCANKIRSEKLSIPPYSKSFAYLYPEIAATWSENNTCTPFEVYPKAGSTKRLWICPIHGEYEAMVYSRTNGQGCYKCGRIKTGEKNSHVSANKSFAVLYPSLLKEYSKENSRNPFTLYSGSNYRAKWVCKKGHKWYAKINDRTGPHKSGCPHCFNAGISLSEKFLRAELITYGALPVIYKLGKWSVDIYFPESKTVVEYDGSYYHSNKISYERDRKKSLELLEEGYKVIRVRTWSSKYRLKSLEIDNKGYYEVSCEDLENNKPSKELLKEIKDIVWQKKQ